MELLQNTQTARLVLAYLYNQQLESLGEEFCRKSPYLRDELHLLEIGDIPVRPFCRSLVQIFSEYNRMCMQLLTLIGQYEDKVSFPESLSELDKMDMILNFNRSAATPCLQNSTNISTQSNQNSVIVAYTSQIVKPAANTAASISSEPLSQRPNDAPHAASDDTVEPSVDNDSVPTPTISLGRADLLQLLMCEQDKENDGALSYLLQQETAPDGNVVSEQPINRPMKEKVTVPQDGMVLPTHEPPLPQTSHLSPANPDRIGTTASNDPSHAKYEVPAVSACHQSQASAEVAQTGMKEIVAARILGSMAKAGFRSGTKNDTPPGNPIVTTSGGTRSTSSRKRSHIRILDFGTPASKRSNSVPGSADNAEGWAAETASHSRQLFAGQGTPASVDGSVPEMPSPATFAMPASTEVHKAVSIHGHGTLVRNSQDMQHISPISEANQIKSSHTKLNVGLTVCSNASATSVSSVVTANETYTQVSGPIETTSLPPAQPQPVRLHSIPEASKQTNRTSLTEGTTDESKPWPRLRIIASPEKKPRPTEQTRRVAHFSITSNIPTDHQPFLPSQPTDAAGEETTQSRKNTPRTSDPSDLQHIASPRASRIATRSSTKKAQGDGFSVNSVVSKSSKLPTKDSIPKMVPRPGTTGTVQSYDSATNPLAPETIALHTAPLETPFKIDPLFDYPMTPRFLTDPFLSVSKLNASAMSAVAHHQQSTARGRLSETADINTPGYPITPGALATPKSHSTSPSSAVCYYRPDEGDTMHQTVNETLPAECTGPAERLDQSSAAGRASEDFDKMEIVSGGLVFVISTTPLLDLYQQDPSGCE